MLKFEGCGRVREGGGQVREGGGRLLEGGGRVRERGVTMRKGNGRGTDPSWEGGEGCENRFIVIEPFLSSVQLFNFA